MRRKWFAALGAPLLLAHSLKYQGPMALSFDTLGAGFPAVVSADDRRELSGWAGKRKGWVTDKIKRHGGILFRGFGLERATGVENLIDSLSWKTMRYKHGTAPRKQIQGRVHTSTEVKPYVPIPVHNEMSYAEVQPRYIVFACLKAPTLGGETPLADMQGVYRSLPKELVDRFEQRGVRNVRYVPRTKRAFHPITWPEMYQTDDKSEVERQCAGHNVDWDEDDGLILTNTQRPSIVHPHSASHIWFNQIAVFHRSLSQEFASSSLYGFGLGLYERLTRLWPKRFRYPYDVTYGDGAPISLKDVRIIRRAIWDNTVSFPWQEGDLLVLDNFRIGHGRNPFRGKRQIGVALIE